MLMTFIVRVVLVNVQSKSKVNLPVDVLQPPLYETWPLYQDLRSRHFSDKPISGLISAVFYVYWTVHHLDS